MKLRPTSEYHEDFGNCIFINFSRDEDGTIRGEPPEIDFKQGYLEEDFDESKWTHFIEGDWNFIFTGADPINFPDRSGG